MKRLHVLLIVFFSLTAYSAEEKTEAQSNVKYKGGKEINFEELLIQGQMKRPEISVVTGNVGQGTDGLVRLREDFLDVMAMDVGEEVQ